VHFPNFFFGPNPLVVVDFEFGPSGRQPPKDILAHRFLPHLHETGLLAELALQIVNIGLVVCDALHILCEHVVREVGKQETFKEGDRA